MSRISELNILREFRRRARNYLSVLPEPSELLDWLSIIQHHGGPTRLLDFTYSFYVAAFFAIERASADAAVWVVDRNRLARKAAERFGLEGVAKGSLDIDLQLRLRQAFNVALRAQDPPCAVAPIEPYEMTERLSVQQGLFLASTDVSVSFEKALAATFGQDSATLSKPTAVEYEQTESQRWMVLEAIPKHSVVKIIIPRGTHPSALEDLWNMNVTAASLFPGLDGYVRSLSYYVRQNEEDQNSVEIASERLLAIIGKLGEGP